VDEIRFIDLFSGIGGFRRGLELSGGYRCVWSCDNNKYANQVYTSRFGEENHNSGDIRKVRASSIQDHDLLCAGFPCQAFSVAGKRHGFRDTRGTLFFEIARIARAKRPSLLLLENVKGLLSHDEGLTYQIILESLEELGYLVEWQVLNSKHFGVPQNRERVFIIGHLRGRSTRPVFPITEIDENAYQGTQGQEGEVSKSLRAESGYNMRGTYIIDPFNKAERQDMMAGAIKTNQGSPTSTGTAILRWQNKEAGIVLDDTVPTLRASGGTDIRKKPVVISNSVDTSGYLREMGRHEIGKHGLTDYRIRRLTPVECERLQGFPDGWTEFGYEKGAILDWTPVYGYYDYINEDGQLEHRWGEIKRVPIEPIPDTVRISDTQRYKCLGNAVTVNVIKFLGDKITEALN